MKSHSDEKSKLLHEFEQFKIKALEKQQKFSIEYEELRSDHEKLSQALQILMEQNGEMKMALGQTKYGGTYNEIEGEPPFGVDNQHAAVKNSLTHPQ